jgi:hypothetical protein
MTASQAIEDIAEELLHSPFYMYFIPSFLSVYIILRVVYPAEAPPALGSISCKWLISRDSGLEFIGSWASSDSKVSGDHSY